MGKSSKMKTLKKGNEISVAFYSFIVKIHLNDSKMKIRANTQYYKYFNQTQKKALQRKFS